MNWKKNGEKSNEWRVMSNEYKVMSIKYNVQSVCHSDRAKRRGILISVEYQEKKTH